MKVLCVPCDEPMRSESNEGSEERSLLAVTFACPHCGKRVGLLTNPAETQLATSIGYQIGGRRGSAAPMEMVRKGLTQAREMDPEEEEPVWTEAALKRLRAAPSFVQGIIHRVYSDYAREKGHQVVTPEVMNEAREALGMTGM